MAVQVRITGVDKVLKNLKKEIAKTIGNSKKGLIQVGFLIKAGSMRKSPVDLGNLRSSHYVSWDDGQDPGGSFVSTGDNKTDRQIIAGHATEIAKGKSLKHNWVAVGVSAFYAIFVHENARGYTFKVGQEKFFETAIAEVTPQALRIIQQKAKLK